MLSISQEKIQDEKKQEIIKTAQTICNMHDVCATKYERCPLCISNGCLIQILNHDTVDHLHYV